MFANYIKNDISKEYNQNGDSKNTFYTLFNVAPKCSFLSFFYTAFIFMPSYLFMYLIKVWLPNFEYRLFTSIIFISIIVIILLLIVEDKIIMKINKKKDPYSGIYKTFKHYFRKLFFKFSYIATFYFTMLAILRFLKFDIDVNPDRFYKYRLYNDFNNVTTLFFTISFLMIVEAIDYSDNLVFDYENQNEVINYIKSDDQINPYQFH